MAENMVFEGVKGLAAVGAIYAGASLVEMYLNGNASTLLGVGGAGAVLAGADEVYWAYRKFSDM